MSLEVWQNIRQEAKQLVDNEPMLASFFSFDDFKTSQFRQCIKLHFSQ